MPLVSGSSKGAFDQNVRTLMGEVGKSPHVQSRQQALAIAYSKQRQGRADGGTADAPAQPRGNTWPWQDLRGTTRSPLVPVPEWHAERPGKEPQVFNERARFQQGGPVGGLVDHDQDPELPPLRDDASLHDMIERQPEPAYLATIRRLMEGQRRLDAMHPVQREMLRRYWLGGLTYWMGGLVK